MVLSMRLWTLHPAWLDAKGIPLDKSVGQAQQFVHDALKNSVSVGKFQALGW